MSAPDPGARPKPKSADRPTGPRMVLAPRSSEVDVWVRRCDPGRLGSIPIDVLDPAERNRAARFRFARDRDRSILRTIFLREVLARYLAVPPAAVPIRRLPTGKPVLDPGSGLSFNLSHSAGVAVVAVAAGMEVGIDLERSRPIEDAGRLAEDLFAAREVAHIRGAAPAERAAAFLQLWTRKEAVVKALGAGLSIPLDRFTVLEATGAIDGLGPSRAFHLVPLDGLHGFVGAVAALGALERLRIMTHPVANDPMARLSCEPDLTS